MVSILCVIPNQLDATSLYRASGPLNTLARTDNINLIISNDTSWPNLKRADIVFFQRPHLPEQLAGMRAAKENGKKIWVDYDDNLYAVPTCNPRFSLYGNPQIQHTITTMVAMADKVTVSTDHLNGKLLEVLKCFPSTEEFITDPSKIITVNNAYDPELHPRLDKPRRQRTKKVAWRGSFSHCKDLWLYTAPIKNSMEKHQAWNFEFMGEPFWLSIEEFQKVCKPNSNTLGITAAMDPVKFYRYLEKQAPEVVIVPLEDQGFNRSKSNIAYIEATAAGAITLAPDWHEWSKPGAVTYTDDFAEKLDAILSGKVDTEMLWEEARNYVLEHASLASANKKRLRIIDDLMRST